MDEANSKPNPELGVYRVTHWLVRSQTRDMVKSDLIFMDGAPFVVLEWAPGPEGLYPDMKIQLDPERLSNADTKEGYFVYQGDVLDPRKVQ